MPRPQISLKCQQCMKVFAVNSGTSASIFNAKTNVLNFTLMQVSGVALKGKRELQLLRKSLPVSVLWGNTALLYWGDVQ